MRYCNKDDIVCIDYLGTVRYTLLFSFIFLMSVCLSIYYSLLRWLLRLNIAYLVPKKRKQLHWIACQSIEEQRVWSMRRKNAQEIFGLLNKFSPSYVRSGVSFFLFLFFSLSFSYGNKSSWDNCRWSERAKLAFTFICRNKIKERKRERGRKKRKANMQ
jgi:hypothetical protein